MNDIGKRIKDLRKKNDLTQEKLADFLGVTYKAVSKWECGITTPDLALIVPMARLFHVSTDTLLGMQSVKTDERKLYFDSEYFEFWKKEDHEADYLIAKQAVMEYPDEYKYLYWLSVVEYYISFNRTDPKEFLEIMDRSIKHSLLVYENCLEQQLRNNALWNIICAYRYSNRIDEAKTYAMLYPESDPTSRDDAIAICLQGEELLIHQQAMISDALENLCGKLGNIWTFGNENDPRVVMTVKAEKKIIEAIIPDQNTLRFSVYLLGIHEKLANIALQNKNYDLAVTELKDAKKYAIAMDQAMTSGKQLYTTPILDHFHYDYSDCRPFGSYTADLKEKLSSEKRYDPIRKREDFQELLK